MAKPNSKPRSKPRSPAKTEKPPDHNALTVFPHQLRAGDRYRDDATGKVWEVAGPPSSLRQGNDVAVRLKGLVAADASGLPALRAEFRRRT